MNELVLLGYSMEKAGERRERSLGEAAQNLEAWEGKLDTQNKWLQAMPVKD